jgi:transposase InsO family protein
MLYIIQHKFDVFSCFKKFQFFSLHEIGDQILKICSDCGGEFMNIAFQEHLAKHGIDHDMTTPYTLEQNGVVEDDNHTIVEMVCSMLHALKIDLSLWVEVVQIVVYNIASHTLLGFTPLEMWCGKKPNLSDM